LLLSVAEAVNNYVLFLHFTELKIRDFVFAGVMLTILCYA
jgi:hypothetical protein